MERGQLNTHEFTYSIVTRLNKLPSVCLFKALNNEQLDPKNLSIQSFSVVKVTIGLDDGGAKFYILPLCYYEVKCDYIRVIPFKKSFDPISISFTPKNQKAFVMVESWSHPKLQIELYCTEKPEVVIGVNKETLLTTISKLITIER